VLISAVTEPGIGDDGEPFADQRRQAEIRAEVSEHRRHDVVCTDQAFQHARNRPLTAARWPDDQEGLLLARVGGKHIAEDFL